MALEKVTILNLDTQDSTKALFNPKEYTITKQSTWVNYEQFGRDMPEVHFTTGSRRELSMELFFDTYDTKKSVKEYVKKIESLMYINVELHRPPIVVVTWGKEALNFKCVLEQMEQRYTMFLNDGTPVRAVLNVLFKEIDPEQNGSLTSEGEKQSPDHTKVRVFKNGDSLQSIAFNEFGDSSKWKLIAQTNDIDDPLNVEVGKSLYIPVL
jgi:hypothetical protein